MHRARWSTGHDLAREGSRPQSQAEAVENNSDEVFQDPRQAIDTAAVDLPADRDYHVAPGPADGIGEMGLCGEWSSAWRAVSEERGVAFEHGHRHAPDTADR